MKAAALCFGGLLLLAVVTLFSGCASGPQVVPVTPVVNITCNQYISPIDGGHAEGESSLQHVECWIDGTRATGEAAAQGVEAQADVDTTISTEVSATR